ncbi:hypothetical protein ACFLWY_05070, partial [Chloroflexota bacterium]
MWKRLKRTDSLAGLAAISLSAGSFIGQFVLEGWAMELTQWLTFPAVLSPVLALIGMGLIIWNFTRKELTFTDKQEIVKLRQKPISKLKKTLIAYKDCTNQLSDAPQLSVLETYGLYGTTSVELYAKGLFKYNKPYIELCENDGNLISVKSDIEMLISELNSKKLKKNVHSLFKKEQIAHAFGIFQRLYKLHYHPAPEIEERIHHSNSVPLFEQAFGRVYVCIDELKRGK